MNKGFCIILTVFCLLVALTDPAVAAPSDTPKSLGTFGAWTAYSVKENGQTMCYMVVKTPVTVSKGKKSKRGAAWLTITQRPAENSKDVVSYTSGYNFQASEDVLIHIGKDDFDLFTQKDTAWSRDAKTDHALTEAIRKNTSMTITGTPAAHGAKPLKDTLDIKGADAAYHAVGKACGLETAAPPPHAHPAKKAAKTTK